MRNTDPATPAATVVRDEAKPAGKSGEDALAYSAAASSVPVASEAPATSQDDAGEPPTPPSGDTCPMCAVISAERCDACTEKLIATLTKENAELRAAITVHVEDSAKLNAIVGIPETRDGDWYRGGLLAVGQRLLELQATVATLTKERDQAREWAEAAEHSRAVEHARLEKQTAALAASEGDLREARADVVRAHRAALRFCECKYCRAARAEADARMKANIDRARSALSTIPET